MLTKNLCRRQVTQGNLSVFQRVVMPLKREGPVLLATHEHRDETTSLSTQLKKIIGLLEHTVCEQKQGMHVTSALARRRKVSSSVYESLVIPCSATRCIAVCDGRRYSGILRRQESSCRESVQTDETTEQVPECTYRPARQSKEPKTYQ